MVASSVDIASLPDGVDYPDTEARPEIEVVWSGGTGPFNVEYTWDDDPTFGDGNGNRQQVTNNSVTSPDSAAPSSDLADLSDGTTWYIRANVVDTGDSNNALADDHEFTYFATNPLDRTHLHLLGNVGVAFHDTDEPAGGWGVSEGGTEGADGDITEDFRRYLYLIGNVGAGFTPTDDPLIGWGVAEGGTEGPDGETLDFDRFLYLLANVDTTQPCPLLFALSSQTVSQGASLTIFGQGLVSATSPTADAWDAEVRLYETADLAGSFVVLAISDYESGTTQDSITVTIPPTAESGFVAVVHTTGATCAGSNFIGLTVLAVEVDAEAGWWVEVWDIRNSQRIISALPDVIAANTEHIAGGIGNGELLLPRNHPDIPDILDRTATPPVQRLIKVYQHNRFAYAFLPDDIDETYTDDGAAAARLYGDGQERMLKWGRALFKDLPASVTSTRNRLYGSEDNLAEWLTGEADSLLDNGGLEEATKLPWQNVGTATSTADNSVARTGAWSLRITPAALNDGNEIEFSGPEAGRDVFADIYVRSQAPFDKTYRIEILDADDTVIDFDTVSPGSAAWIPVIPAGTAALTGTHRLRITQTAGTLDPFWVDDAAAYARISGTFQTSGATLSLSRTNVVEGLHSLKLTFNTGTPSKLIGFFNAQAGQDYTFAVTITGSAADDVRLKLRIGGEIIQSVETLTGGADTFTLSGTAGDIATTGRFEIQTEEASGSTIHIDAGSITPGFPAANGGELTLDTFEDMQTRLTLDFIVPTYDRTFDSAGLPWPEDHQLEVPAEWTLWDLLDHMQGLGYRVLLWPADYRGGGDTGWELNLYYPGNSIRDLSTVQDGPAILPGPTVESATPSSAAPLETVVYGEGPGGLWSSAELDAATLTALERREGFISNRAARSATTVFRAASQRLTTASQRGDSFAADLTDDGDPLPYFHFLPEDALRAHLPSNETRDHVPDATYRAAAITSRLTGSGRTMSWQVDFGNYALHKQRIESLVVARQLERETSENYRPGTGTVGAPGLTGGAGTPAVTGIVAPHEHVASDLAPSELGGDLKGTLPDPTVAGFLGIPLSTTAPTDGQAYVYDNGSSLWVPGAASDTDAIHDNVPAEIDALAEVTPVAGDWLLIEDTSDSDNKKKVDATHFLGGGGGAVPEHIEYLDGRLSSESGHTDDLFFTGTTVPGTAVDPGFSTAPTWNVSRDRLEVRARNNSFTVIAARVFALTPSSSPVTIETVVHPGWRASTNSAPATVLGFSDGTSSGSKMVAQYIYVPSTTLTRYNITGTFASLSFGSSLVGLAAGDRDVFARLAWQGANDFKGSHSAHPSDDDSMYDTSLAAFSHASGITPTHYFVGIVVNATGFDSYAFWDFVRVWEADRVP